jgi:hypothetical protein
MTSEEIKKLFEHYAEDARFQDWNKGEASEIRFVYACEYGTFWKFTPKEWWQLVERTVRSNGCHDFFLSNALRSRPRHIVKGQDNRFYSSDLRMRCVNPLDWTLQDWTNELTPGGRAAPDVEPDAACLRKPNLSAVTRMPARKGAGSY